MHAQNVFINQNKQDSVGTILIIDVKNGWPLGKISVQQNGIPAHVAVSGEIFLVAFSEKDSSSSLAVFKPSQMIRELCPAIGNLHLMHVSSSVRMADIYGGGRQEREWPFDVSMYIYLQDKQVRRVFTMMPPEIRRQPEAPAEYKALVQPVSV